MVTETVRQALEAVLYDRAVHAPRGSGAAANTLLRSAMDLFDQEVKSGVPELRASLDASIWFAREEVRHWGY